ncbi:methionine-gamma-lyase [Lipingzhangella halophila]|uniref:homocysteine desulfhydrase n=1 Tax=Lipingzhangella halophila TaxID=1783352 RepID=A0A7W7W0U4_9ACTN|nr:aminotransferase class I/II-fold pyridoxal phosphate-dependent enzyme [Lipingzhangella halophila]MBB4930282.1 methionine-gamma-lyase [Lipingzhangella halophila]
MTSNDAQTPGADLRPASRTVHPAVPATDGSRPLGPPLYQSHVFGFSDTETMAQALDSSGSPYIYGRYGNPTIDSFETAVADLEGGAAARAAGSGMGTITSTLWSLLSSGDHVVAQNCLYGGTQSYLDDLAERWGIEVTAVDADDAASVRAAIRPNTRVLFLETIANPTGAVADIPRLAAIAREAGVTTVVDNTFATPLLCRPIEHGADIVVHSATKYLGGHADVLGGVAVFADAAMHERVSRASVELGAALDPFAAWLLTRGMQTLGVRVAQQCANAQELAQRLAADSRVAAVYYPGLAAHPGHETARKLLTGGYGGVLAFELTGGRPAGKAFAEAVRLASLAPSLGDVKTLVTHAASVSHRKLSAEQLARAGIGEGLIRVSVGIEDVDDLWEDMRQALDATEHG